MITVLANSLWPCANQHGLLPRNSCEQYVIWLKNSLLTNSCHNVKKSCHLNVNNCCTVIFMQNRFLPFKQEYLIQPKMRENIEYL